MKKIILSLILILSITILTGCEVEAKKQTADEIQAKKTAQSMSEANRQIGMPAIKNFQERKLAKLIFELRDKEELITYAYIVSRNNGKLVFIGKCIGFGLPYSVQYTNPEKIWMESDRYGHSGSYNDVGGTMPQADPNGLFMPQGLSATWLMMIDPKTNQARPVYMEPEIIVSPFRLH